jgi:hypothetical protein
MKVRCMVCGKEFKDDYIKVNDINKRIYCNCCVDELYKLNMRKKK